MTNDLKPSVLAPEDDPERVLFIPPYQVQRTQHGYAWETDGSEGDHAKGMEALQAMMAAPVPTSAETPPRVCCACRLALPWARRPGNTY